MKKMMFTVCLAATVWQGHAQSYDTNNVVVQTFAGSGFTGYLDGQGTQTMFASPSAVIPDSLGNLFVFDIDNSRVRKITPDGAVSTFAGGGNQTTGYGTNVSLPIRGTVTASAAGSSNSIWFVSSTSGIWLYHIDKDSYVSRTNLTVSGINAYPNGVCQDSQNNIYYSTLGGNQVYRYGTNGAAEVFVGSGNSGALDGNGVFTSFKSPAALVCDAADNIYVWDSGNNLIRRINQNRDVETIAGKLGNSAQIDGVGTNASFNNVYFMSAVDSGDILMACGSSLRKLSATTNVTTIAGSFSQSGYTNGAGNLARFSSASGVCISEGVIYVADSNNERIRSITFHASAEPVMPANLQLDTFPGLRITGTVGRTYQVQSSPDMTNWLARATLFLTYSPYLWIDQNPVSGNKFYRAFLLP